MNADDNELQPVQGEKGPCSDAESSAQADTVMQDAQNSTMPENSQNENVQDAPDSEQISGDETADNGENALQDAQLDALDAAPTAIRRGRIVVVSILILFAAAIATLIAAPPLSWVPPKKDKTNFELLSAAESVVPGGSASLNLAYAPVTADKNYKIKLVQMTSYDSGHSAKTELTAVLRLSHPTRSDLQNDIAIMRLFEVEVHVFNDGSEVALASAGSMLEGVSLFASFEPKHGLGRLVPDANINPQTARVLFVAADAVRYMWLPVPEENVGHGARWKIAPIEDKDGQMRRTASSVLYADTDGYRIETDVGLEQKIDGTHVSVGSGKVKTIVHNGSVLSGVLDISRTAALGGASGPSASQTVHLELQAE